MAELSGILGAVNGASTVRNWRISEDASQQGGVASNTKKMKFWVPGNRSWTGSYASYGHTPSHLPGEAIDFLGSIDGAKGVSGNAIVDSVEIVIDIEGGAPIAHVVNFSGNGELVKGVAAVVDDDTTPSIVPSLGRKVEIAPYAEVPTFEELPHVRTATIRLAAENSSYADSSTEGWVKRLPGNIEASLTLSLYSEDENLANAVDIEPNLLRLVRVYVTTTSYWLLDAILFQSITDVVVDREAASIVGFSANGNYTGQYDSGAGVIVQGEIKKPDTTVWWPAA